MLRGPVWRNHRTGKCDDGRVTAAAIKDGSGLPNVIAALRASGFDEESLRKILPPQLDAHFSAHLALRQKD
jgi:microsomal dipeptidase-like Zn-dependent dipeptidase